jgi:serine/threonine protein phosphatase PrpC
LIIILIIESDVYIANVGDSRCLLSMDNGKTYIAVTKDHKPNTPNEIIRIKNNGGNIYQSQTIINNLENAYLNGKILIGPYRVIPGRLSVCRTIGDAEAKIQKFGGNPNVIISTPDIFYYNLKKENLDFFILGCDGIYDQMTNKEILDLAWMILKTNKNSEYKENGLNSYNNSNNNNINNDLNDIHYKSGLIVDLIIKSSLARKSFDNVTCLFIGLKDFFPEKPNGIDINKNNNELNNTNDKNKINPAFSGIATQKIIDNINSNGGIVNNIEEKNKKDSIDRIYTTKKKSNILKKKIFSNFSWEENKSKTNRNDNRKDFLNNINSNTNNKMNRMFNTNSKINSINLFPYSDKITSEEKNNTEIKANLDNGSEKNNFRKIHKKPQLTKGKAEYNNKLLHKKIKINLIAYTKKNQSFNKINNKYINNKTNNYKHIKKNIIDINSYNTYTSKKLSEPNTNRLNNNSHLNKTNNFHIFKPISKLHKSAF